MTIYRSSTLQLVERYCPYALDLHEQGTPREREGFQAGIAAHAVLQAHGDRGAPSWSDEAAEATVRELVTHGRSFDGIPEPPMQVGWALAGRDIARGYMERHSLPEGARYEVGLAIYEDGKPAQYGSPGAWYQGILDVVGAASYDDGEFQADGVFVRDWKSAWPTDADELDTVQLRGQAVLAAAAHPEAAFIRREVVNLRTGRTFEETTWLNNDGRKLLDGWRRDIAHLVAAAEARGEPGSRPARPGACCLGCPFLLRCGPASYYWHEVFEEPSDMARSLAVVEAAREQLIAALKLALAKGSRLPVEGGTVGYQIQAARKASAGAAAALAHTWFRVSPEKAAAWDAEHGDVLGLLQALAPGASGIEAVGKVVYPFRGGPPDWKERRAGLEAACLETVNQSRFGVQKNKGGDS